MEPMKPGYKTSEFWLTLVVMILGALMASGVLAEGHWALQAAGMISAALAKMGYSASRGKAKVADAVGKSEAP